LKEISLVQQAFITEYPKEGDPSYSVIKNIFSNFEKHGLVEHVSPKQQKLRPKTKNG
jgi:ribosomal protein S19E (S16A)